MHTKWTSQLLWHSGVNQLHPTTFFAQSLSHMLAFNLFALRVTFRKRPVSNSIFKISSLSTLRIAAMVQEYKIKDLSCLDLKNGEKREVEVEGIENGKVLLAKVGEKTHAMSAKCTHYGAPLKLGVLTPDGRLTCAWHGGEIQDVMNGIYC